MAYTRTTWLQRLTQYQNRFSVNHEIDGTETLTPVEGTVSQVGTAITPTRLNNLEAGVASALLYGTTTNSGNDYSLSVDSSIDSLAKLVGVSVRANINANSTGAVTLNVNALTAKSVKMPNGDAVEEIYSGSIITVIYNGTDYILQGGAPAAANGFEFGLPTF